MERDIDRNDVDIEQLFRWSRKVEISDLASKQTATVYMRIVGDADLNRARVYGLRKSSAFRKALTTEGTEEREAYILNIDDFKSKENTIGAIQMLRFQLYSEDAAAVTDPHLPKKPKDDSLKEQERYQEDIDNYKDLYAKEFEKNLLKAKARDEKTLMKLSDEEVYKIYQDELLNALCGEEMLTNYYAMCVYYATYKDSDFKERAFDTVDDILNLPKLTKSKLIDYYKNLELGLGTLKK